MKGCILWKIMNCCQLTTIKISKIKKNEYSRNEFVFHEITIFHVRLVRTASKKDLLIAAVNRNLALLAFIVEKYLAVG